MGVPTIRSLAVIWLESPSIATLLFGWMSLPEGVIRAHRRIAGTNQHAAHMDAKQIISRGGAVWC